MAKSEIFNTGDFRIDITKEHLFLSVTPAFKQGPGIKRDGVTLPRMKDPHSISEVTGDALGKTPNEIFHLPLDQNLNLKDTTNALEQRAGTWTIYHHLNEFYRATKDQWLIIGAQSCGDLTMNPWHVAYIGKKSYLTMLQDTICGMLIDDDYKEPIKDRVYRCLVKWNGDAATKLDRQYEFLDLKFISLGKQKVIQIYDSEIARNYGERLGNIDDYDRDLQNISPNIAPLIEFALAGKTIIQKDHQIPLSTASDKFQDVRHIFSLPYKVKCSGYFRRQEITTINLGEYQLYGDLNARRAALCGPIIIDTDISQEGSFHIDLEELKQELKSKNFKLVSESPRTVGEYCIHNDDKTVEIYFPKNVYPFGVLGMHDNEIICLSSSGLSGRIGNTLEGITRIMIDGFSCQEAMVLDEGFDVFQIINPNSNKTDSGFQYNNEELLDKVLAFTHKQIQADIAESEGKEVNASQLGGKMKDWPLNRDLLNEVDTEWQEKMLTDLDYSDIFHVKPGRSQIRSVIIFAKKQ